MTPTSFPAALAIACITLTAPLSGQRSGKTAPSPAGWDTRRARTLLVK